MKDIRKLGSQCMADLASINIPYGKVRLWVVNCRAKARWGLCKKRPDGCYEIEIAEALLQDDVSDIAVKNTIIHKLSLPNSRSIFIINSEMSNAIMGYQEKASEIYNVEYVRLEKIHKMNGHPTIQGMRQIREQIMAYLEGNTNL